MSLHWDGSPDAYYIMGHVSHNEGMDILRGEGVVHEDNEAKIGRARNIYGRWSMQPGEDGNGHVLREYNQSGRGRFKITAFGIGIFAEPPNTKG